jgi:hypothetical protein
VQSCKTRGGFFKRLLFASTAIALLFGLSPASAMCGGDQAGGMPAASKSTSEKSEWRTAPSSSQPEQKSTGTGMCPCCKNMAMMDGMKSDDPHKGMDMQKQ